MFETTIVKVNGTQARRLLRDEIIPIYPNESRPFLPQTFLIGKVMHGNSRRPGFVRTIDFIGATGRAIILCSLLCSLLRHDTVAFRTTNYVTSCVRWSFWPREKRTHFRLRNPNFEVQKIRQESAFDRLKPFSCVHEDINNQTGQNYFLLHRHFNYHYVPD